MNANAEKQRRFRAKNAERLRVKGRAKYAETPRRWETHLLRNYGLTAEAYTAMLAKQDGKCAICTMEQDRRLHVDHCHDTKAVRALASRGRSDADR